MQLVHQKAFSCTKSTIQCSWYTRNPFPVPTPRFKAIGTPDGLSLYKLHDSRRLVHQTAFCLLLPRDPNDDKSVVLEIRAGIGGEEGALFAADLLRMYTMYAERRGFTLDVVSLNETELGGVKEAVSCTNSTIQGSWYTRKPFPVPTPIIKLSKR